MLDKQIVLAGEMGDNRFIISQFSQVCVGVRFP